MRTSNLFISTPVVLFLLAASLLAQPDSVSYKSQFQFHLVNGYSLSYLNFLSNSSALRYKLDFNLSVRKGNSDGSNYSFSGNSNYSNSISASSENNFQSLNFAVQYLWYPLNESVVRIFLGAGPLISFNRNFGKNYEEPTYYDGSKNYNSYESLQYSFGIGINGTAGVECFITRQLSFIGEYGISGSYSWTTQKNSSTSRSASSISGYTYESNANGWNIGLGNLRLGVAFRF